MSNDDPVPQTSNPSAMLDCALSEMEEQQKKAADHYFRLRPQLLRSLDQEALFRAGFEHAFVTLWRPDRGRSSDETSETPWVAGPPKTPGSHVVHYESGYYAVLTLTPDSMVLRSRRDDNPYGIVRHFKFDAPPLKAAPKVCGECGWEVTQESHADECSQNG